MDEQKRLFLPLSTRNRTPRIAIVGYSALGQAIEACFDKTQCNVFIADEKFDVNIDNVMDFAPDLVFVCYEIESHESGRMDATKVEDAFLKILRRTKSAIAVCSDLTPDIVERMCNTIDDPEDIGRFIYWPSFAKPESIGIDTKQPNFLIMGGVQGSINDFKHFLNFYSDMIIPTGIISNPIEACYVKCAVNGFLSLKSAYVNQMYDALDAEFPDKVTKHLIMKSFMSEPRIGASSGRVLDYNGNRGFCGEQKKLLDCFLGFSSNYSLLETATSINDDVYKQEEDTEIEDIKDEVTNVNNE
jgi:UDP-glucose 6-dehydrogenase